MMRFPLQEKRRGGFTLLEIMVVVGIVGILASVVIAAIAPRKQIIAAQDARRNNNITQLQKAMVQYLIDYEVNIVEADLPTCTRATELTCAKPICKLTTAQGVCNARNGLNFEDLVPEYLTTLPVDMIISDNDYCTGYMVYLLNGSPQVFNPNLGLLDGDPVEESRCGQQGGGGQP